MPMTDMRVIENLELNHLDFAEACALVDCLAAALEAMATVVYVDDTPMDRLALIHAAAMRRKHEALDERESKREENAEPDSDHAAIDQRRETGL